MKSTQSNQDIIRYIKDVGALTLVDDALPYWQNLFRWQLEAEGSMPETSWRALQYDWKQFIQFCNRYNRQPLPASPETIRLYLLSMAKSIEENRTDEDEFNISLITEELKRHQIDPGEPKKIATIERRASTLAKAHRAAQCMNPVDTETVNSALKKIRRITDREPQQRDPIEHCHYVSMLTLEPDTYREHQDLLITFIGFETGLRRQRIADIHLSDIEYRYEMTDEGKKLIGALIRVRKDKNQHETKYKAITAATAHRLKGWLSKAEIHTGTIFRGITGRGNSKKCIQEQGITGQSIQSAMQRCMKRIGMPSKFIGGHSTRIGGALFLREKEADLTKLIAYGDWKTPTMPLRYTKKMDAQQSTMANLLQ